MDTIILNCSSNIFHITQPDGYVEQENCSTYEEQADDNHRDYLNEAVIEMNQPSLFGGHVSRKRCNLPKGHPEYSEEGHYEIDGKKYLHDYLARGWFDTFEELLASKEIKIKLTRKGTSSPREYNFGTDACLFDLEIKQKDLDKICKMVLAHKPVFEQYLKEYHSDCSGFSSTMPKTVDLWERAYNSDSTIGETWEKSVWQLLEMYLFAFDNKGKAGIDTLKGNIELFGEAYVGTLEDLRCNGVVSNTMNFIPDAA